MNEEAVTELVQETLDLLDAGEVGLYEFMWDLNTTHTELSIEERRAVARQALDQLLAEPDVELIWMKWPGSTAIRRASIEDVGADAWNDIGDDKLYLAIDRAQTT